MKHIEKLAIKYLLIGFGIGILRILVIHSGFYFVDFFNITDPLKFNKITFEILSYSTNIIVGTFILFDSIKYVKNKLIISLTGFLMPVFGVCFLIIEKYLILKTTDNE
ncbi:hypothetical protein LA303_11025 [Candidatus Sulfidibacterium hydrothermale]|uniref:hypothetical protein n=1 Tax=Candidatus Sulfidibacterium hydrothermale TaxID=2875962 RepID=UPI001F0B71AE|nr:hypothetical protein [Candidatus Sulfidibacterium hydrothermale]UBM61933.1 hypothetical protein LA303_11025 [Candidatus Sulfidibacterium hydrothermale]